MTATTEKRALSPDGPRETRAERARSEPMAVSPVGGGIYDVVTGEDTVYAVDLLEGRCTCPDYRMRNARCKHIRRVAIDVTEGRVPPPGMREAVCNDCRREFFVEERTDDPVYCGDCTLDTGDAVVDRETGDLVVVARVTDQSARQVRLPGAGETVADYPSNRKYDPDDPVVEVVYPLPAGIEPDDIKPRHLRRYSFPRGRLTRRD